MSTANNIEQSILDILYKKALERPLWITVSEIYWILPYTTSEEQIRGVLSKLVSQGRVHKQADKYQISPKEFIVMQERPAEQDKHQEEIQMPTAGCQPAEILEGASKKASSSKMLYVALLAFVLGILLGFLLQSAI